MSRSSRRTLVSHKLRPFNTGDAEVDRHLDEQLRDHTSQVFEKLRYFDKYTPDHELTAAEADAGITPTDFTRAPSVEIDAKRYGFVGDGTTNNDAAWTSARAVLVALGGGVLRFAPGSYAFSVTLSIPVNVTIEGCGSSNTTLKCTANTVGILLSSTTARNNVRAFTLQGNAKTGTGLQIGDTDFTGVHRCEDLYIQGWAVGVRLAAALWAQFDNVYITANTVGIDFNAGSASTYSTTVSFWRTIIDNNDLQGVKATYVPINNHVIGFFHCTIQENCKTNTALPQFKLSDGTNGVTGLIILNPYVESSVANIPAFDLTACSGWSVADGYINNLSGSTAFQASAGNCSSGEISGMQVYGCSVGVNITTATDVIERKNYWSGGSTITLTGFGCRSLSGNGVASWQELNTSFTPTIKGAGTAGTPTYTLQTGIYTKVGNLVFFQTRVSISAKGGMVGAISIEGLPLTSNTQAGAVSTFAARFDGVTVSGGNTAFHAELANNSTSLQLWQSGSAAASQVVDTQLAAATTILVSGCYQTAT